MYLCVFKNNYLNYIYKYYLKYINNKNINLLYYIKNL